MRSEWMSDTLWHIIRELVRDENYVIYIFNGSFLCIFRSGNMRLEYYLNLGLRDIKYVSALNIFCYISQQAFLLVHLNIMIANHKRRIQ